MIMVSDVPESLLLSYENLAAEVSVAEAQKDLLSQFLRLRYPSALSVAEGGDSPLNASETFSHDKLSSVKVRKLTLRCVACFGSELNYKLDPHSVRIENARGNDRFQASFQTVSGKGRVEIWRVAVQPDESGFCIRSATVISPANALKAENFQAVPCKKDSHGSRVAFFESVSAAKLRLESVRGLRFGQHIAADVFLNEEHLAGAIAVKASDRVRVILQGSSDFQITTVGRVMQSGQKGQIVKVELEKLPGVSRNSAKRTIDAVVDAPGEVSYVR